MHIPNILTAVRFLLAPLFVFVFFSSNENYLRLSAYVFVLAGITDVLDGYIARRFNLITKWGQAMDPLADKIMQLTVLICLTINRIIPIWVIIIVGIKEALMIIGGVVLYTRRDHVVIPARNYGKISTILFYMAVLFISFGIPFGIHLLFLAIIVTLYAFTRYFKVGMSEMKKNKISQ